MPDSLFFSIVQGLHKYPFFFSFVPLSFPYFLPLVLLPFLPPPFPPFLIMKYMKNVKLYVIKQYFCKCPCPHYLHQRIDHHQCLIHLCAPHLHVSPTSQPRSNHCLEFRVAYFFAFYTSATYVHIFPYRIVELCLSFELYVD